MIIVLYLSITTVINRVEDLSTFKVQVKEVIAFHDEGYTEVFSKQLDTKKQFSFDKQQVSESNPVKYFLKLDKIFLTLSIDSNELFPHVRECYYILVITNEVIVIYPTFIFDK